MKRRAFLKAAAIAFPLAREAGASQPKKPTRFQIACMTLPYSQFPLERALKGIQGAGYRYVAWGTTHAESAGERVPVIAPDAPPQKAKDLAARCRDLGLEPLMMFSMVYPEAKEGLEVLTQRIRQAAAGGIPQVLTFGHTEGGDRKLWIERFRKLGPIARAFCASSDPASQQLIDTILTDGGGDFARRFLEARGLAWAAALIDQSPQAKEP